MGQGATERDRLADEREAALDRREATLTAREANLAERMDAAQEILAAADQRDAVADARDVGAESREQRLDRAQFIAKGDKYGNDLPARRGAALDREHAKGDRSASGDDRIALTEELDEPEAPRP
jgi:hypothetical protein